MKAKKVNMKLQIVLAFALLNINNSFAMEQADETIEPLLEKCPSLDGLPFSIAIQISIDYLDRLKTQLDSRTKLMNDDLNRIGAQIDENTRLANEISKSARLRRSVRRRNIISTKSNIQAIVKYEEEPVQPEKLVYQINPEILLGAENTDKLSVSLK